MSQPSVLAEFCSQASFGLGLTMALLPDPEVDPWYFRTQALVLLGLSVLAGLGGAGPLAWWMVGLSWVCFVFWSVGRRWLGRIAFGAIAALASWLVVRSADDLSWGIAGLSAGAAVAPVYAAMLLGHWYLVWPWMSIRPLMRALALAGAAVALRVGVALWHLSSLPSLELLRPAMSFVIVHWAIGLAGPALGLILAWRCALIRSTQSATGILYAATAMALLGEIIAGVAADRIGYPL